MDATEARYGIPDIDLPWSCGGTVNPSCFAGHQLVVLFLPTDPGQGRAEFMSYDKLAGELAGSDAWYLVIGDEIHLQKDDETPLAHDADEKAWRAFRELAGTGRLDRSQGAAFMFTRGGVLHRVWAGSGHAREVAGELANRR